jgi:hypothetical protein
MHARTNGALLNTIGWATTVLMSLAAIGAIITSLP